MSWFLWFLLAVVLTFAGIYRFFPARLAALIIGAVRLWGRTSSRSIDVDGISWPYLEGGPADGEIVVMLHGFGGDKDNWPLYARYFTKRYRVIAPDLPGFGDNVRNPDWHYGAEAQTGRLYSFFKVLGLDKFHLAGNSMGGFIALNYALTHPEQLKSLTLIDNAGVTSKSKSELELEIDAGKNPLVAKSLEDFDRLMDFVMHKRIPAPKFMMRAMLEVQLQHFEFLDRIFWTVVEEGLDGSMTERLGEVAMPTLVVWGRHDRLIDISCADIMAATIPDNKVVIVEDAGHVPMIESPHETANHHITFIDECCAESEPG